jgi:peptide deformylase
MALRNLRKLPDPLLRKISRPIEKIDDRILVLIDDMVETMYHEKGVGLAAPQIGVLKRLVVIDIGEGPIALINPKVIETSGKQKDTEGCLSVPGKIGIVERPEYVKVSALNENNEEFFIEGEGLMARALLHEIDHLDGRLYIDIAEEVMDADGEEIQ